jgi:hypothetical protein
VVALGYEFLLEGYTRCGSNDPGNDAPENPEIENSHGYVNGAVITRSVVHGVVRGAEDERD